VLPNRATLSPSPSAGLERPADDGDGTPSPSLQITAVGDDAPGDQLGDDFYFFDIKNAVEGDVLTVYGLCPSNYGPYIGGLTFDSIGSIVQPSRGMLIIVR